MNWIETSAEFKYSGKPVKRLYFKFETPIGDYRAFEVVSGKVFSRTLNVIKSGDEDCFAYMKLSQTVGRVLSTKKKHKTLEEAKLFCEEQWNIFKTKILDI